MSRYAKEAPVWAPHPREGWVKVVHRDPQNWENQPYVTRAMKDSEDVLLVAHKHLGSATRYWKVADMNPAIECPDDMAWPNVIQIPTTVYG